MYVYDMYIYVYDMYIYVYDMYVYVYMYLYDMYIYLYDMYMIFVKAPGYSFCLFAQTVKSGQEDWLPTSFPNSASTTLPSQRSGNFNKPTLMVCGKEVIDYILVIL